MKQNKGFTLVELLATIGIIAVLSAAVFPFVANYRGWAKQSTATRSARLVYDAIMRYNSLATTAITGGMADAVILSALVGQGAMAYNVQADTVGAPGDAFLAKVPAGVVGITGSGTSLAVTYTADGKTGNAP